MPDWRDVIARLATVDVSFHTVDNDLAIPNGEGAPVQYFQHVTAARTYRYPVVIDSESEILVPTTLRSLCEGLGVSASIFHLTMDD